MARQDAQNTADFDGLFLVWFIIASIASVLLLVYACIVPLDYKPISWEEALARWDKVPWLPLGVYHRADWVANTLVVLPAGFFAMGSCWYACRHAFVRAAAGIVIAALLCGLVYATEFLQLWFPMRTVSQNDLLAGCIGAFVGPIGWLIIGPTACRSFIRFLTLPTIGRRLQILMGFASVGAVLYSIFPFDVVVSAAELRQKSMAGRLDLSLSPIALMRTETLKGILFAVIRMLPVGLWLGFLSSRNSMRLIIVLLAAVMLEAIQIPIFTKYATSWEMVAGWAGGLLGVWLASGSCGLRRLWQSPHFWSLFLGAGMLLIPFAFLVRYDAIETNPVAIAERWQGLWAAPLSRYYYTSEYNALTNLAGKMLLFGGWGFALSGLCWTCQFQTIRLFSLGLLLVIAMGVGIEWSQVYLVPMIADFTDVVTYLVGYALGFLVGNALFFGKQQLQLDALNRNDQREPSLADHVSA